MTEHIEPSHLDTPVQNIARTGISKRSADPNKERVATISERDQKKGRQQGKSEESDAKSGNQEKDVYQRQFVDTEQGEKPENLTSAGNSRENGTGLLIDVKA